MKSMKFYFRGRISMSWNHLCFSIWSS